MKSKAVPAFWKLYRALPNSTRAQARKQYRIWADDPNYPSLHFKRVSNSEAIYSIRITLNYRALALKEGGIFYWFWIGNHDEYDRLIKAS